MKRFNNNATLGKPVDTLYLTLSSIFPTPVSTTLGSFPDPTGKGQGTEGLGALQPITYYDQKSTPLPYYQRMLLDVQRQVTAHDVFVLSYSGVQGRKGTQEVNLNLPPIKRIGRPAAVRATPRLTQHGPTTLLILAIFT